MIEEIYLYFTIEMIYLWMNICVLPFWIILIFFPTSKISSIFTISVFPILVFTSMYLYLIYVVFKDGYDFFKNFELYFGINQLIDLLSNTSFLILFWIHFLSINLFCGAWIVNDSQKFYISKILVFFFFFITYFIGPLGLLSYWIIRIFYAKKISLFN